MKIEDLSKIKAGDEVKVTITSTAEVDATGRTFIRNSLGEKTVIIDSRGRTTPSWDATIVSRHVGITVTRADWEAPVELGSTLMVVNGNQVLCDLVKYRNPTNAADALNVWALSHGKSNTVTFFTTQEIEERINSGQWEIVSGGGC